MGTSEDVTDGGGVILKCTVAKNAVASFSLCLCLRLLVSILWAGHIRLHSDIINARPTRSSNPSAL
jgi:hypothetical protein